jgi:hypothetical protein
VYVLTLDTPINKSSRCEINEPFPLGVGHYFGHGSKRRFATGERTFLLEETLRALFSTPPRLWPAFRPTPPFIKGVFVPALYSGSDKYSWPLRQ